jgi:hypothetical protein
MLVGGTSALHVSRHPQRVPLLACDIISENNHIAEEERFHASNYL